ncbi:major facilitator superfamily domain-containing protein 1-like [Dreissena polymorpha]|uniref:major facilitator superfamily domain-containing protein 1-like n=1 Tax=Dreissena polymorpha TaxID=45954 RepID=UPI002264F0AC|nr:major facilitator superfamily domain-containing protein 1-like [Dreissena polymorpha]
MGDAATERKPLLSKSSVGATGPPHDRYTSELASEYHQVKEKLITNRNRHNSISSNISSNESSPLLCGPDKDSDVGYKHYITYGGICSGVSGVWGCDSQVAVSSLEPSINAIEERPDDDEIVENTDVLTCSPNTRLYRYGLLVFLCIAGLCEYITSESPSALQKHVVKDIDISETQYMGFYSTVQWAEIISSLAGGFMVDRIGNPISLVTSAGLITIAQTIFAVGALLRNYGTMFGARIFLGLVSSTLVIACDNLVVKWFHMKELNMVLGLKISFARASSVMTLNMIDPIYQQLLKCTVPWEALGFTLLSGSCIAVLSTLCSVLVAIMDKRADKLGFNKNNSNDENDNKKETEEHQSMTTCSDVRRFPASFWLIGISVSLYYMQLFPFVAQGELYFVKKYDRSLDEANAINSMVFLVGAVTIPLFGAAIDKVGRNLIWMLAGLFLSLASHLLLTFTVVEPYACTVLLGLGYSLVVTTWQPLVTYVIAPKHLGTAFGIAFTINSVCQAVNAYITGYIVDNMGYFVLEVFFIMFTTCSIVFTLLLYLRDASSGKWEL